jgi:protein subunit release factor A
MNKTTEITHKGIPLKITTGGWPGQLGGQQLTTTDPSVTVEVEGAIRIHCRIHRSQLKNKNTAIDLIELALGI